jgi:hypothetical protein
MFQSEIRGKGRECARAIQISHDPHRKAVLKVWQDADRPQLNAAFSPERLAREVEAIGRLHLTLTEGDGRTHH